MISVGLTWNKTWKEVARLGQLEGQARGWQHPEKDPERRSAEGFQRIKNNCKACGAQWNIHTGLTEPGQGARRPCDRVQGAAKNAPSPPPL